MSSTPALFALIVDPDDDTRAMYGEYLKRAAYAVDEASDGREALAKALSQPYEVIVTETRVPGIDGFQLCELLRHDPATDQVSIVIVTGDAYPTHIERARSAGADLALVKPCLPERLLLEMQRLRAQSGALRQRSATLRGKVTEHLARAEGAMRRSAITTRHYALSRAHHRGDTVKPPIAPPELRCPQCDSRLAYQRSHIGGVSERQSEQWDYFECAAGCGAFQYRQRTRKLRKVS